jgi:hypothetical protein
MITVEFDHRLDEHQAARRVYYQKKPWFARVDKVVAILLAVFGLILVSLVGPRWWSIIWLVLAPLLYRAPRNYAIIPKRAFATEEETAEFRRLV